MNDKMNKHEEFIPAIKIALSGINKNSVIPKGETRTIIDVLNEKKPYLKGFSITE